MENELLDHVLGEGGETWARPNTLFLALCTADPTDSGTGSSITEPSGGSYARQECNDWDAGASRATANSTKKTFPKATADWDTLTHFAICDHLTTGNMIAHGTITPNKVVLQDNTPAVEIGDLDVSWDSGGLSDYLANALLDHVLKGDAYTQPVSLFAALVTGTIVDADTGSTISEPTGVGNYARIEHNAYNAASLGATENGSTITFATASATLGTITDVAVCDALTTGNLLFYSGLNTAQPIDSGDTPVFPSDDLDFTMD